MVLPNQLTILRIVLSPVFFFLFLTGNPLLQQISLLVFFIAAITDWYDGWLARKFNYITTWGKFWDPLADKILTSAAFLAFVFLKILPLWMVILILLRDFVVTILRAYADAKGFSFTTSYYAKWKTFIQMFFLYYLLIVYIGLNTIDLFKNNNGLHSVLLNNHAVYFGMLIITLITVHSGISYLYINRKLLIKLINNEN